MTSASGQNHSGRRKQWWSFRFSLRRMMIGIFGAGVVLACVHYNSRGIHATWGSGFQDQGGRYDHSVTHAMLEAKLEEMGFVPSTPLRWAEGMRWHFRGMPEKDSWYRRRIGHNMSLYVRISSNQNSIDVQKGYYGSLYPGESTSRADEEQAALFRDLREWWAEQKAAKAAPQRE